jgi:hypothetical protein
MKICIIAHPRTRSSHLLETLAFYYKIPIIGEDLNNQYNKIRTVNFVRTEEPMAEPDGYMANYTMLVKKNQRLSNGVIRIHPTQLSLLPANGQVLDFDFFDFKQYDKIYITTRLNLSEMVASYFVSSILDQFTYKSVDELHTDIKPMSIHKLHHYYIKMLLYSELIVKHLKEYFQKNNIDWEELDYADIPKYLKTNFPGIASSHVETNYDYRSIVTNYDSIPDICKNLYSIITPEFYKANPQLKEQI